MSRGRLATLAIAVCCAASLSVRANAALDPSFGTAGRVVIAPGGGILDFFATGSSIVAAGHDTTGNDAIAAYRFSANGVPDPSFGGDTDGVLVTDILGHAVGIASREGGGYWLGGYVTETLNDFVLIALTSTGQVDTSFGGGDGMETIDSGQVERAFGMDVDSSGNILLAGFTSEPTQPISDFAVVRFTAEGIPDATFGTGGSAVVDAGVADIAFDVEATASGEPVVVGAVQDGPASQMAVLRLEADGDPDNTFSGDGIFTSDVATHSEAKALALLANGKVLVGGTAWESGADSMNFMIMRIAPQGTVDMAFGTGQGRTITNFGGRDEVTDLGVMADGSILVVGPVEGRDLDFGLARYTKAGILDPRFGKQQTHFFTDQFGNISEDVPTTLALLGDGRFLVAGSTDAHLFPLVGNHRPALARYRAPPAACTKIGTLGNDTMLGTKRADVLCPVAGNDLVRGGGGPDVILGGTGADRLFGGDGKDRLFGEAGPDRLDGGPGVDFCSGGLGRDTKQSC